MALTTEMVLFILTIVGAIAGLWWRVEAAIAKAKQEAMTQASAAAGLASMAQQQLNEHKLHVAETYITKAGLRETTDQIMGAVGEVKQLVTTLNQRVDRIIEDQHRTPRPIRKS